MAKFNRNLTPPSEPKENHWWQRLFSRSRSKDDEPEEITFANKHKRARAIDRKKLILHFIFGLIVLSSLGGILIPFLQHIQAPAPKQEVQSDKSLDEALKDLKEKNSEGMANMPSHSSSSSKESDQESKVESKEETSSLNNQEAINKKVQEELDKATAKVVNEYNKKLEDATSRVQSNNTELATVKAEKEALQRQVDELKKKLDDAKASAASSRSVVNDDRVELPQR